MEGACCTTSSTSSSSTENPKRKQRQQQQRDPQDKPYRGIRMRKWGSPTSAPESGSAPTPPRRGGACVRHGGFLSPRPFRPPQLPDSVIEDVVGGQHELSAAAIRKKATEVGARVDALQAAGVGRTGSENSGRVALKPDLNEYPTPETSEEN
ncbi:hypothetical protein DH2020_004049 [Rehmannia glutinosa]|uniref:Uncharacterized protein n=1 Tax=Rehmannia glutinosa TaxID=99300 RepID=A0ABR0XNB6_REHGL